MNEEIKKDYLVLCNRSDQTFELATFSQAKLVASMHEINNGGHKTGIVRADLFNSLRERQ